MKMSRAPTEELSITRDVIESSDSVFHLTLLDRLADIQEGLVANTQRGKSEDWRSREALIDEVRPEEICGQGINRRNAVFAHPDFEVIDGIYRQSSRSASRSSQRLVALEIGVDPDKVLVCDAFVIGLIGKTIIDETREPAYAEYARKQATEYWTSDVKLSQYRESYDITCDYNGLGCIRKENAPNNLPYVFIEPEVLIPGPVEASNIRWISSSTLTLSEHIDW